jgi:hypothetical protein
MNQSVRGVTHRIPSAAQALTILAAASLVACGGGGGGGSDGGAGGGATALALSGSAATGAAIVAGTVDAKCATGSGTATTGADGSYSLSITSGKLPCLLRVTSGSTVLHSVVAGSGNSAVGNLTPATQLIVARLAAADPAAYYTAFDATAAAAVTTAAISAAQTAVVATLRPAGVDFSTLTDLIGGALRPRAGSAAGDAYDQLLDALAARLTASGITLGTLTGTLVNEAANLGNTTPASGAVSLPPGMLLQPAASNCSALRSGTYRVINPTPNSNLAEQFGLLTLNATTLISRDGGSTTDNPVWVPNGSCRYLTDNGTTDIAVSQAGVLVARTSNGGGTTRLLALAFPEQTHTLAELAGTWNMIGMERNAANTGYTGVAGTGTVDGNGALSAVTDCQNDSTWGLKGSDCAVQPGPFSGLRVNSSGGGFDIVDPASTTASGRQFAYRAGNGDLMMFGVDGDGSVNAYTRQRTNTMPTVGAATASWNFYAGPLMTSTQIVDVSSNVIASVDATAGSFLRNQIVGTGTVTRPETLFINNPRNGYNFRVGGAVVNSAGATVNVSEFTSLPLRGMGLAAVVLPTSKLFLLSVTQPPAP